MADDVAFDVPVTNPLTEQPIRTVGEAAEFVRSRLRAQFTIDRLTTLLVLERAAEGSEIALARQCFCSLVFRELAPVT
jgi:hypothetical protein